MIIKKKRTVHNFLKTPNEIILWGKKVKISLILINLLNLKVSAFFKTIHEPKKERPLTFLIEMKCYSKLIKSFHFF